MNFLLKKPHLLIFYFTSTYHLPYIYLPPTQV